MENYEQVEQENGRKPKEDKKKGSHSKTQGQDENIEFIARTQNQQNTSQKEELRQAAIHSYSKNQQVNQQQRSDIPN